jgi:integrase
MRGEVEGCEDLDVSVFFDLVRYEGLYHLTQRTKTLTISSERLTPDEWRQAPGAVTRAILASDDTRRTYRRQRELLALQPAMRAADHAPTRAPLFCNRTGGKLRRAYIRRLMPQLAEKAGIAKRVHAHGLRHTHAAELRAERVDIGIISKQLGHTSIATTVRYLDQIAPVAVVEAMRGRAW